MSPGHWYNLAHFSTSSIVSHQQIRSNASGYHLKVCRQMKEQKPRLPIWNEAGMISTSFCQFLCSSLTNQICSGHRGDYWSSYYFQSWYSLAFRSLASLNHWVLSSESIGGRCDYWIVQFVSRSGSACCPSSMLSKKRLTIMSERERMLSFLGEDDVFESMRRILASVFPLRSKVHRLDSSSL